jgi:hypothetical protein
MFTNRHVLTDHEKGQIEGQQFSEQILINISLSLNIPLSTIGFYLDRKIHVIVIKTFLAPEDRVNQVYKMTAS